MIWRYRSSPLRPIAAVRTVRDSRGFTLVELMAVMVIVGVLAVVALVSMRQNRNEQQVDRLTAAYVNAMREARARAINKKVRYCVYMTRTTVWWCEWTCPPQPNREYGKRYWGPDGPRAIKWANIADYNLPSMPPTHTMYAKRIYFLPDGSMDANLNTLQKEGFTVYIEHKKNSTLKRRIVVLPLSGQVRTFLSW